MTAKIKFTDEEYINLWNFLDEYLIENDNKKLEAILKRIKENG